MKLLADAHISRAMASFLTTLGHDLVHVAASSPRLSDSAILRWAATESRIVLTADKDFGELCFRRLLPCEGVVLLRLTAATETARMNIFRDFWPVIEHSAPGHFVVVTDRSVRRSVLPAAEGP